MRLFDAILDANQRALAGDPSAGIHVAEFADELPVIALTCIDPRLNRLFPGAMALPDEHFIWLRNAGNIITGPLSSTMRSIALACAVKGGREIAVIGHTDCKIRHVTIGDLTQRFKALGIERQHLPENLTEFFGVFASERQNVIRAVEYIRQSPLIGPKIPVQGLMVNIQSGQLEWVVNGYDVLARPSVAPASVRLPTLGGIVGDLATGAGFDIGEMKFPESKIGEIAGAAMQMFSAPKPGAASSPLPAPPPPPPLPLAPPLPPPPPRARVVPIPPPIRIQSSGRERRQ
jgi:carbonic anhydrase